MAKAEAKLRGVRLSPRKARLVVDQIRGKKVHEARDILAFTVKRTSPVVAKLLESAVANAEHRAAVDGKRIDSDEYVVSHVSVDGGAVLKRFKAAARGRGMGRRKPTSHIQITISDGEK